MVEALATGITLGSNAWETLSYTQPLPGSPQAQNQSTKWSLTRTNIHTYT